jgi:hypothetical protein
MASFVAVLKVRVQDAAEVAVRKLPVIGVLV